MILALDVGNSQILAGLFDNETDTVHVGFRKSSRTPASSDELGLFLQSAIRANGHDPAQITRIACCSVVPDTIYSLRNCCRRYFGIDPFILGAGAKTGLKIRYRNPLELGADRVAAAIAGARLYPESNLVILDFGTATTIDAVTTEREHLGGIILPGIRIQMEALEQNTARLPSVEIRSDVSLLGRSTTECIQAGLYYGTRAAVASLTRDIREKFLAKGPCRVIATGGFARLFEGDGLFDELIPDLVLLGLKRALLLNPEASRPWTGESTLV